MDLQEIQQSPEKALELIRQLTGAVEKRDIEIEQLQVIPEQISVEQHVRPRYACRHCEGSGDEDKPLFRIAPAPPSILPGSIVTSGFLAFILVNKFCDHLPFYRQKKRFERIGAHLSRQNMSNWMNKAYLALQFFEDLFKAKIKEGPVIQMDETTVQVLGKEERPDTSKSYMWVARGGPPKTPLVFYEYQETRNYSYAKDFLAGYSGYLQTDGYPGYETAKANDLNPYGYLRWVFDQAAVMDDSFDRDKLLPWNCDQEKILKMTIKGL